MDFQDFFRSKIMDEWRLKTLVIVTDTPSLDGATALRAGLELFGLRVALIKPSTRKQLYQVLGGDVPESEHVILCCHGDKEKVYFGV